MIRLPTCPICSRELPPQAAVASPLFPFCSVRCRQVDLWRWCEGKYTIVDQLTPERLAEQQHEPEPDEEP